MANMTSIGKRNARNPLARGTLPGFACVGSAIVAAPSPACAPSQTTRIKLAISACIVAPQGHAITVALRTLVARRALVRR